MGKVQVTLDILAHADYLGRIRKTKLTPGLAAFSATIDSVRAQNPAGTILMDAGDEFAVNFWGGKPVAKALQLIGTDVLTLGNHEFDWGKEFLEETIAACEFPVLCSNIVEKDTDRLIKGTRPYTILERQGVKIGVLGITTEYTPYMVEKSAFSPFQATSAVEAGKRYIPEMREKGADIIVVLAHVPFYVAEDSSISGELWDILTAIPPVDVFIGGHIPGDYAQVIGETCVLKAGFAEASLGHARLVFDLEQRKVVERSCQIIHTDPNAQGRPEIAAFVDEVVGPFEAILNEPLAVAEELWEMTLARECKLGDFLADCMRFGGQTQLAYMNATSSGGRIEPGVVTRENFISVSRFNDPIHVGEITGEQLYELVELVFEPERFGNNASILISGFHMELDHTKPSPHKVIRLTLPDGTPIDRQAAYTVATSEYMASGGNDTSKVARQINFRPTSLKFHDAIFAYARELKVLKVEDWPRVKEIGTPENDNSPF
jgi:2',3'-cyclic-nucleotide 2'-phosphodiesterase (5'-nucleotidase family)